jgi:hypothetical protein
MDMSGIVGLADDTVHRIGTTISENTVSRMHIDQVALEYEVSTLRRRLSMSGMQKFSASADLKQIQ